MIEGISTYLPENALTNFDLNAEFPEWDAEKISNKTGIRERRIAKEDEFVSDMAIKAANQLFSEYQLSKDSIDFIILCTQSPDYFLPTTACIVQDKLQIPKNCGAIDFNLGCSGYVYGLALSKGLLLSGCASKILFITSEAYSKQINQLDKSNRSIFGDAATASLITLEDQGHFFGNFVFGTDGSGFENLIVKNGGIRHPKMDGKDINNENGFVRNDNNLYMNGQEIFKFCTREIPKLVMDTLSRNNLSIEEIDLFVFHQANKYMLDYLKRRLKIPDEKFYLFFDTIGNTVSSTIPIALKNAKEESKIQKGSKVLIAGFGVGYSMSATVLTF
jgi:3-oxoacyl-[acyl-carrier-protein] synthase-3